MVITAEMAAQALRQVDLPASVLEVQPPGGRTLVNFETNFYTGTEDFERTVRLLGQRVDLRIRPASFEWRFGDGTTSRTSEPGAPYPRPAGDPQLPAQGRGGARRWTRRTRPTSASTAGPWAPVAGTVTIPGAPWASRS